MLDPTNDTEAIQKQLLEVKDFNTFEEIVKFYHDSSELQGQKFIYKLKQTEEQKIDLRADSSSNPRKLFITMRVYK